MNEPKFGATLSRLMDDYVNRNPRLTEDELHAVCNFVRFAREESENCVERMIKETIDFVKTWPEWKKNMLKDSAEPFGSPRNPVFEETSVL